MPLYVYVYYRNVVPIGTAVAQPPHPRTPLTPHNPPLLNTSLLHTTPLPPSRPLPHL